MSPRPRSISCIASRIESSVVSSISIRFPRLRSSLSPWLGIAPVVPERIGPGRCFTSYPARDTRRQSDRPFPALTGRAPGRRPTASSCIQIRHPPWPQDAGGTDRAGLIRPSFDHMGNPAARASPSPASGPLGLDVGRNIARLASDTGYRLLLDRGDRRPGGIRHPGCRRHRERQACELGTGVLAIQLRTPMLAAMGAATLQSLAGENDVLLGVGISSPVVVGRWHGADYGDSPLAPDAGVPGADQACLSGDAVSHDGEHYSTNRFRLGVRLTGNAAEVGPRRAQRADAPARRGTLRRRAAQLPAGHRCAVVRRTGPRRRDADGPRTWWSCTVYAYVHVGVCDPGPASEPAPKGPVLLCRRGRLREGIRAGRLRRGGGRCRPGPTRAGDREGALAAMSDRMVVGDRHLRRCSARGRSAVQAYRDAGVDHPDPDAAAMGTGSRDGTIEATLDAARPDRSS